VSEKGVTLTGYQNQASEAFVSVDMDVDYGGFTLTGAWPGMLGVMSAGAVVSANVDIGGAIYVYSDPTAYWYSMYPQISVGIDILEDRDVKFEPKETRLIKGIIKERKRAEFVTAFTDELASEEDVV